MPSSLTTINTTGMSSAADGADRVLVIDDTPAIHEDFRKVLVGHGAAAPDGAGVADLESVLFGDDDVAPAAPACPDAPLFVVGSALQGEAGVELLKASIDEGRPFAMAFVDMRMPPGWDGVRTIKELWRVDPDLQVVICTAYSDYGPDQIARALGIDSRLLILRKPFDPAEVRQLAASMCEKRRAARRNADLQREVDTRTAELRRVALHDALTGLPNRVLFSERLDHAIRQSRRDADRKFAVLFIDADDFKVVNDSLGHDAGDALLLQMAERIGRTIRGGDTLSRRNGDGDDEGESLSIAARLGGDEFVVILDPIKDPADAARVAGRLLESAAVPYDIKGSPVMSSMSIGIAVSGPSYLGAEEMLRDADTAMYHAKRNGRSQFAMFESAMHSEAVARLAFESDLRAAVARGQIKTHYQPIVEMRTRRLVGFEALARWDHPTRGLIPPEEFIPLAEHTGVIAVLGLQILDQACRQLAAWQKANPAAAASLTMSVNLSRKQLRARDLDRQVDQIIKAAGVNPRNVRLEITEACVLRDEQQARDVLLKLQALRVQLDMDDLGGGRSVPGRLHDVSMDGLKLDRDFVRELAKRPEHATIVKSVVALARTLNIPLVAEGVETPEEGRLLESLGCGFAQGYLYAEPMTPDAAGRFIEGDRPPLASPAAA